MNVQLINVSNIVFIMKPQVKILRKNYEIIMSSDTLLSKDY